MLKFPTCISTIWRNHLPHLTSKWRGTFQYFQSHDKIPYIYYLEKPSEPVAVSDGALFNISSIQKKHEENIKWEIIVLYSQIFFLEMLEIA